PAFLTPSIQEYHTSTCLTSKNHTNLRIAFYIETKDDCYRMFPIYNLLTRVENPVRLTVVKPNSPRFSYFELTLTNVSSSAKK
ncbi:hypothetical protein GS518_04480, partial [Leptospira interrogans]